MWALPKMIVLSVDTGFLFKEAGDLGAQVMHKLCNTIWSTMKWPEQWTQAIFVLLPKTGDLKECNKLSDHKFT